MYFLGIDIGKRTHVASLMSEEGKVILKGFSFPNTTEGADSLIERLSKYSETPADFIVGMEATGHYWLSIFSYLHESDFLIHVVNPLQTDGWRKGTEIRKRKNDIIDSVLIADLMRYGSFVETVLSDENVFFFFVKTTFTLPNLFSRYRKRLQTKNHSCTRSSVS